ncbi:MAG TPA: DUF3501 family protein [Candidatus Margulisiibacteriota bacterium]|nr:DUF3501 family protein [Candidatus Margulisiibacteriota bacterium]
MKKVTLDEVMGLERYEQMRSEVRHRIIALKKQRRVAVGEQVTFVFENHDTMWFQIHEMLRAEHIVDLDRVRDELDVYNSLIPEPGELSATMLIEITEESQIRERLVSLIGIDQAVTMEIGNGAPDTHFCIRGAFEAGRSTEDKLSAVQYVRFPFTAAARHAFIERRQPVRLVIDHPNYRHQTVLDDAVRRSLAQDLEAA